MDLNTCLETTKEYHTIAIYSHLVPTAIILFLGLYLLFKTKFSLQSRVFLLFSILFCTWLLGDLITWLSTDYNMVVWAWSQLDNINIIFFSLATYFVLIIIQNKDIDLKQKLFLAALTIPGFYATITGGTVVNFDQATCNVVNSDFLTVYKLIEESICVAYIAVAQFIEWKRTMGNTLRQWQTFSTSVSFALFLSVFALTEYLSSSSNSIVYAISLYGLFILPLFLLVTIFSIVRFETFHVHHIGVQLLVYVLIIMVASQFLFLNDSVNIVLNSITLFLAIGFGYILLQSVKSERRAAEKIEILADELQKANIKQASLLHFIAHEVKGYLTKAQAGFATIVEGDMGQCSPQLEQMSKTALADMRAGVSTVMDILEGSNLKRGTIAYNKKPFDLKSDVISCTQRQRVIAEKKGLVFDVFIGNGDFTLIGDEEKIRHHVIHNMLENAIKYTPKGSIHIDLIRVGDVIRFSTKDTGVGVTEEDMPKIFIEGGKGKDSIKVNVDSTGYGLFVAKTVVDGHGGKIWCESEGAGKGSRFVAEFTASET
jgi:signal transduction histidine kinase